MNKSTKEHKGGRKPKDDKANFRYTMNLTSVENAKFQALYLQSGMDCISKFMVVVIFEKEIKVVKMDKNIQDYFMRLTQFYTQFQAIGNNYNQIVKALKSNFSEKKALAFLYKLEKATLELVALNRQIIELTQEFETKYLSK